MSVFGLDDVRATREVILRGLFVDSFLSAGGTAGILRRFSLSKKPKTHVANTRPMPATLLVGDSFVCECTFGLITPVLRKKFVR